MGFLIEILGEKETAQPRRELISEEELLKTHSREMYNYLKSTLRYEIKVPVKKSEMMSPNFDEFLENINRHQQDKVSDGPIVAAQASPPKNKKPVKKEKESESEDQEEPAE
jgi:hypothetical protein